MSAWPTICGAMCNTMLLNSVGDVLMSKVTAKDLLGNLPDVQMKRVNMFRRQFLVGAGLASAAVALGSSVGKFASVARAVPSGGTINDTNILNFALNLEYLEAEFYLRATTGAGLSSTDAGSGAVSVLGGTTAVPFKTPAIQQYANEIAADELAHVRFLRSALGSAAVSRPSIDLMTSLSNAATAAGIAHGSTFSPFA